MSDAMYQLLYMLESITDIIFRICVVYFMYRFLKTRR